jgi:hypothetical protein
VASTANGKVVGAAAGVAEGGLQSRAVRRPAVARGGGWQRLAVEDGYGSGRKRLAVFKWEEERERGVEAWLVNYLSLFGGTDTFGNPCKKTSENYLSFGGEKWTGET